MATDLLATTSTVVHRKTRYALAILIAVGFISSCNSQNDEISERLSNTKAGQTIPLAVLFPSDVTTICLRTPYQPIAMTLGMPHQSTEHLDEGSWAFVFEKNGKVENRTFRRSQELDVASRSRLLPDTLRSTPCAPRESGVVFRFDSGGRRYITLAQRKG
jgi:hypothetical protein